MCGVFGVIDESSVFDLAYHGLIQLQHRGQDGAGVFAYDPKADSYWLHKDLGLVRQVFAGVSLPLPEASWAIGHVRYSTIGSGCIEDTQPHCIDMGKPIAIVHNGNIVNYLPLRKELEQRGVAFESSCDAEAILHLLSQRMSKEDYGFEALCRAVNDVYRHASGAYSIIGMISGVGMFAFRDPLGFRPLLHGVRANGKAHAFASETDALTFSGFQEVDDVKPGEVVFIDKHYSIHRRQLKTQQHTHCSFEFNYFAKPNAVIEKREVYRIRSRLGRALGKKIEEAGIEADVVVAVPDTARPSSIALARYLKIPFEEGLIKRDHVGRTFIMPTHGVRKKAVAYKLAAVSSVFFDKAVIVVDDSIVRGTVSQKVTHLAKQAGAKKIYFASTYPPIRHPCVYGIDFPRQEQLIAWEKTVEEICEEIGAEGLIYNDVEDLKEAIGVDDLCTACLTGNYSTEIHGVEELQSLRFHDLKRMEKMECYR